MTDSVPKYSGAVFGTAWKSSYWKESIVKVYRFAKIASLLGILTASSAVYGQVPVYQGNGLTPNGYPVQAYVPPQPGFNTHPPVARGYTGPIPGQNQFVGWQEQSIAEGALQGIDPNAQVVPSPVPLPQDGSVPSIGTGVPAPMHMDAGHGYAPQAMPTPDFSSGNCATGNCGGSSVYGDASCGAPSLSCGPTLVAPKPWFFGAGALFFNRVDDHDVRLTYDSNMPTPDYLSTDDARIGLMPGFEITGGRYFHCGQYAIAGTYWGLFPGSEEVSVMPPVGGNFRPNMPGMQDLDMPGQSVYDWYDGAAEHRLIRNSEVHNVEVNLLGFGIGCASRAGLSCPNPCATGCNSGCAPCNACVGGPTGMYVPAPCSRLSLTWLAGFRYFRFQDYMQYASSEGNMTFDANDLYYTNNVSNDLFGFQIGGFGNYCLTNCISVYSGVKMGVYGNHMNYDTSIGTGSGTYAVIDSPNAYDGMPYNYMVSDNDVALLGEWDLGLGYRVNQCWSIRTGYRVVAASGVATAVGQIPYDYINVGHLTDINNNDALILHGAYVGLQYNF